MGKSFKKKLILFLASIVARPLLIIYRLSLKIKIHNRKYVKACRTRGENILYSFWHENMIIPLLVHEKQGINVLVSQHFDGEVIAKILRTFGCPSIRGSSTRGGWEAYQTIKSKLKAGRFEIAFTPDGPRGPRRQSKLGIVRLAAETGAPIILIAVAASRYYRLKSWDRLFLILPFSRCTLIYNKPFYVPATTDLNHLNLYAEELTNQANLLEKEAYKCLS